MRVFFVPMIQALGVARRPYHSPPQIGGRMASSLASGPRAAHGLRIRQHIPREGAAKGRACPQEPQGPSGSSCLLPPRAGRKGASQNPLPQGACRRVPQHTDGAPRASSPARFSTYVPHERAKARSPSGMCVYILLVSPSQGIFSSLQSELTVSCEGFSLLACYKKAVEKMCKLRAPSASCRLGRRPSGGLTVSCGWLPSPALALAPFAGRSRLLVPLVRARWFRGRSPARRWASAGSSRARQESKAPTRARRQLTSCAPRAAAGAQRPSTDGFF